MEAARWVKLCELDEVPPGEMWSFVVERVEMLLVRGHESYLVIPPSCPHMANPLIEGFFDGAVLTCSKHLWQWSVRDAQPIGEAQVPLLTYASEIRDGAVWVNLEKKLSYGHEA